MKDSHGRRLIFGDYVDRIFWGLLIAVCIYASNQIRDLNRSVEKLNVSIAVITTKLLSIEDRLYILEVKNKLREGK